MSNIVPFINRAIITMSSREIAELTGKRHDHVLRDIRTMLAELYGEDGVPGFEDTQINPQNGQSYPIFSLPKREAMILVSGYSVAMRAKIIDRWQELEAQASKPAFTLPDSTDSMLAAFERTRDRIAATGMPKIADLRFHDLRHTGITRLFWAGLKIEEVAQVSGHSNWAQLKRYTHIRPEDVHRRWGQLTG